MDELTEMRNRLGRIIVGTCNRIGCKNCDLKWDNGCSATELENQIYNIEFGNKDGETTPL